MSLEVQVIKASGLVAPNKNGKCNPFVQLSLRGIRKQTNYKQDCLDPVWDEIILYNHPPGAKALTPQDDLDVVVKSHETLGINRSVGSCKVSLQTVLNAKTPQIIDCQLEDQRKKPSGSVQLKLTYLSTEGAVTGDSSQGTPSATIVTNTRKFSSKPEKFQIRVKVSEGRQLIGESVNALTCLRVCEEVKQTSVVKATCNPRWNDSFQFCVTRIADEFFQETINFEVFNSKFLRSDALIGTFQLSCQSIYNQSNHCYLNRWLVLTDPNDDAGGVTGYLKVSIAILATGDDCPAFKSETSDPDEDVESNLLWPETGLILQPATFSLDLYKAEDLPRMDSNVMDDIRRFFGQSAENKELVDPYFIFSFCGKTAKSKVVYCCDHPDWQQTLHLGFMFPSLCNSIKLILMDWDRISEDDIISTAFINLPSISASGEEGFLPSFGPCFVNFYGSKREFTAFESAVDDDMNAGKILGCAYRGRVLLALKTVLGSSPEESMTLMQDGDVLRVSAYCRRRRYLLQATFLDATMFTETNESVEFEVTIGLYGNRMETSVPCLSSTLPSNAVFDGCNYYYIPWSKSKPCILVPCQWEDISFRLEALNILERILHNLESNVKMLYRFQRSGVSVADQSLLLSGLLDQVIADCQVELPVPLPGYHVENELDKLLRLQRRRVMDSVIHQATQLKSKVESISETLEGITELLSILRNQANEPQNSIPDVFISMLVDKNMVAFCRIPAHQVLYSSDTRRTGINCNKIQTLILQSPGGEVQGKIPGMLRMKIALGLQTESQQWQETNTPDAELCIYAETYENQVNVLGSWKSNGAALRRPAWSDVTGQLNLPREKFTPPEGWQFQGNWFIDPELSSEAELESGVKSFLEIVIEYQTRSFGGFWYSSTSQWTDVKGNSIPSMHELNCPDGWEWEDLWEVDLHRAVDEEGWEYAIDPTLGGFSVGEKSYHMYRRRRWIRQRILKNPSAITITTDRLNSDEVDGWEYAPMFSSKFHQKELTMDLVRRRRWHRKLVTDRSLQGLPVFKFPSDKKTDKLSPTTGSKEDGFPMSLDVLVLPRMYLVYKEEHHYQLQVYIYQARDLIAADQTGLSDPFALVCFQNRSQKSKTMKQTLCPMWDQTLVFDQLVLYGDLNSVRDNPPKLMVEIYDEDNIGAPEYLGRTTIETNVFIRPKEVSASSPLSWHQVVVPKGQWGGELLAASELYLLDGNNSVPHLSCTKGNLFTVPASVRPALQRTAVEILCWGVRNMKTFELLSVSKPSVQFQIGDQIIESSTIKDVKDSPNFKDPLLFLELMLPKDDLFMPPINIKVIDHRQFGRTPVVGTHVISSLKSYWCDTPSPVSSDSDFIDNSTIVNFDAEQEIVDMESEVIVDDIDWWSKYFASMGDTDKCGEYLARGYEPFKVYPIELERIEEFEAFSDLLSVFPLSRGKQLGGDNDESVGEFKGTLRLYALPTDQPTPSRVLHWVPTMTKEEALVRIYVVRAYDLAPKDPNGLADPYVVVKLGNKKETSKDQYKPNTLNPVFGMMFEMKAVLPMQKDLTVQVYDYDFLSADDLIGETVIDLENRYLTKYRATCGVPKQYFTSGPFQWRDSMSPWQILECVCKSRGLPSPQYHSSSIVIGKDIYQLQQFEKSPVNLPLLGSVEQRLALHVLQELAIVPEHLETRRLFNPMVPGLEQGKLEMWVDIFPESQGPPGPPVTIEPRMPKRYELRCIVWNTTEVEFKDLSISGEKMSDIYVKGWIDGVHDVQKTDVHYRSTDGDGNFNWRFIFPLDYLTTDKVIVVKKKQHFWNMDVKESSFPPKLCIQLWDNDIFASDDFIGSLEMELLHLPKPAKKPDHCSLHQLKVNKKSSKKWWKKKRKHHSETIDLFDKKHVKGFWPCIDLSSGKPVITGKIEMELELLTEEETLEKPAGKGRDEPNANPHLETPKRPEVILQMMMTPWKAFRVGVWDKIKWHVLTVFLISLCILFVLIALYTLPQAVVDKIVFNY